MFRGRLGAVQKLENRHRKYYCVMHDVAKNRHENMEVHIAKEQQEFGLQRDKSMAKVRQKFVKRLALKKCLQENRVDSSTLRDRPLFGHYNGRSLQSFAKDIDTFLAAKHPQVKKKEKCQSLLEEGQNKGRILGEETMADKVKDYLTESWGVKYATKQKKIDYFDEDLNEKRRRRESTVQKLPPIFSLYKISLKPLEHRRRDSYVHGIVPRDHQPHESVRNSLVAQSEPEEYFGNLTRRQRFQQLARNVACTKPACVGYQGNRTRNRVTLTLPTIYQKSFMVRQIPQ